MANEKLKISPAGMSALRFREGAVLRYYNDSANNCTYGIGTLVHKGLCTDEELKRPVTTAQVNMQLATRVSLAEATVRRRVKDHELTQDQFDSLVSFVYNSGATGAVATLNAANQGDASSVVIHMKRNVYVHPIDEKGKRLPAVRVPGLMIRRQQEAAAFEK